MKYAKTLAIAAALFTTSAFAQLDLINTNTNCVFPKYIKLQKTYPILSGSDHSFQFTWDPVTPGYYDSFNFNTSYNVGVMIPCDLPVTDVRNGKVQTANFHMKTTNYFQSGKSNHMGMMLRSARYNAQASPGGHSYYGLGGIFYASEIWNERFSLQYGTSASVIENQAFKTMTDGQLYDVEIHVASGNSRFSVWKMDSTGTARVTPPLFDNLQWNVSPRVGEHGFGIFMFFNDAVPPMDAAIEITNLSINWFTP